MSYQDIAKKMQAEFDSIIEKHHGEIIAMEDGPEKDRAMVDFIIGGYVAFASRTAHLGIAARPLFDRIGWRQMEKEIENHAKSFMSKAGQS